MSVFSRLKSMMSANINDAIDKFEDPVKGAKQAHIDTKKNIAEVKVAAAGVIAEQKKAAGVVAAKKQEIDKIMEVAQKAAKDGNREHLTILIAKKNKLEAELEPLLEIERIATANAKDIRSTLDKLVQDEAQIANRVAQIKANDSIAKAQQKAQGVSTRNAESAMERLSRFEEKTAAKRNMASAMIELNAVPKDEATELMEMYAKGGGASTDIEVESLMAQFGHATQNTVEDEVNQLLADLDIATEE